MYADDTSLTYASEYIEVINDSVNEDLYNLKSWLQANKLSLNVAKTQCLAIGSRRQLKNVSDGKIAQPALVVSDENISNEENIKYLGVIVDKHLS